MTNQKTVNVEPLTAEEIFYNDSVHEAYLQLCEEFTRYEYLEAIIAMQLTMAGNAQVSGKTKEMVFMLYKLADSLPCDSDTPEPDSEALSIFGDFAYSVQAGHYFESMTGYLAHAATRHHDGETAITEIKHFNALAEKIIDC